MAHGGVLWNKGRRTLSVRHTCRIPREMRAGFSESQHALTLFGKIPKACQNTLKGDTPYSPLPIFSSLHLSHSTALRDTQLSSADANCTWCWCSSTLYCNCSQTKHVTCCLSSRHCVDCILEKDVATRHWFFISESLSSLLKTTTHHNIIVFYKFTSMAEMKLPVFINLCRPIF